MFLSKAPTDAAFLDDNGFVNDRWVVWLSSNSETYSPIREKDYNGESMRVPWMLWFEYHSQESQAPYKVPIVVDGEIPKVWQIWFTQNTVLV